MLKTLVKVSRVNNLSNARYCAGMGVEMLGFDMDTMLIEQYSEIKNWVSGVKIVGETKSQNTDFILEKLATFKPDLLEINGLETAIELYHLSDIFIILNEKTIKGNLLYPENIQYLHFHEINNDQIVHYFEDRGLPKLIISAKNLKQNNIEIKGDSFCISIEADTEERPGFSNFENTMEILEALELDD